MALVTINILQLPVYQENMENLPKHQFSRIYWLNVFYNDAKITIDQISLSLSSHIMNYGRTIVDIRLLLFLPLVHIVKCHITGLKSRDKDLNITLNNYPRGHSGFIRGLLHTQYMCERSDCISGNVFLKFDVFQQR